MTSLEGWGSAIELRPRSNDADVGPREVATPVAYRLRSPDRARQGGVVLPAGHQPGIKAPTRCADRRSRLGQGKLRLAAGMWRSLAARLLWEQEAPGSNPGIPTSSQRR